MKIATLSIISLLGSGALADGQITATPTHIDLPSDVGSQISISDASGSHVKFRFAGVDVEPNFLVVIPSSGTTPASVQIGLNPNVVAQLQPGGIYTLVANFTAVDQTSSTGPPYTGPIVTLHVPAQSPPSILSVVNSASLQPTLSPGALVSIFGSYLTGPTLSTTYDDTGSYPTSVANTSVTFNGVAAPLLYVSPSQINAIVPFALAGQTSLQVAVQRFDQVSASFTVPLQDTAPAIFTSAQNGTGQAAALQQAPPSAPATASGPLSYNSSNNPAAAGEYLEIFATGEGLWTPPPQSDIFLSGEQFTTVPVSLTIGGQTAKIMFVGTDSPLSTWSVLQVNAIVPAGLSSGPQPVVLKIGANDSSSQKVTIAVQ